MYGDANDPDECQNTPLESFIEDTCDEDQTSGEGCHQYHQCVIVQEFYYNDVEDTQTTCQQCSMCPVGYGVIEFCTVTLDTDCESCDDGDTWSDVEDAVSACKECTTCEPGYGATSACTVSSDTVCELCSSGATFSDVDSQTPCETCTSCEYDFAVACSVTMDTICNNCTEAVTTAGNAQNAAVDAIQADLDTCNSDLSSAQSELDWWETELDTCTAEGQSLQDDLDQCNSELSVLQSDCVTECECDDSDGSSCTCNLGDINEDGAINVVDVVALVNIILA